MEPYRCEYNHVDDPVLVVAVAPAGDLEQPLTHRRDHHHNRHSAQR